MTILRRRASRPRTRSLAAGVAVAALALPLLAGCSPWEEGADQPTIRSTVTGEGTFAAPGGPGPAVTHDPAQVPEGAVIGSTFAPTAGGTTATVTVEGLLPNRGYAVHAHQRPCGPDPVDAGQRYQNVPDPGAITGISSSTDPTYANPRNEYWLDLRTDASGAGTRTVLVPFRISVGQPASLVVLEGPETQTAPGVAGEAGARLACVSVGPPPLPPAPPE